MLKNIIWENPSKMSINTGHKIFDSQCDLLSTGNVWGTAQFSSYIRAYNDTVNPLGEFREQGCLQEFDLKSFQNLPDYVRKSVCDLALNESVILYEFRHFLKGKKIVHGYVITDYNHNYLKHFVTGPTVKSVNVINECMKYVAEKAS